MILQSYPWYINDWLSSETRLSMNSAQRGIYRDLLDYCWLEGSLPTDLNTLEKMVSVPRKEFLACWSKVKNNFFEGEDGRLHNAKADEKRPELIRVKEIRKRGADLTNEARKLKQTADAERSAERRTKSEKQRTLSERFAGARPPSPSPSPSPSTTLPCVPPSADETDEPLDLSIFATELRNQFPVKRRGSITRVQQAVAEEFGPYANGQIQPAMDRARRNLAAYLASDDVQRGVCFNAARWISDGLWQNDEEQPDDPDPFAILGGRK